jgi:hypothetical protein
MSFLKRYDVNGLPGFKKPESYTLAEANEILNSDSEITISIAVRNETNPSNPE